MAIEIKNNRYVNLKRSGADVGELPDFARIVADENSIIDTTFTLYPSDAWAMLWLPGSEISGQKVNTAIEYIHNTYDHSYDNIEVLLTYANGYVLTMKHNSKTDKTLSTALLVSVELKY